MLNTSKIVENAEHFFGKIADVSPVVLYIFDLEEMRNVWVNQPVGALLGYDPIQIAAMGENLLQTLMHPEDWARYPAHFEKLLALETGERANIEYRMKLPDGSWRWLLSEEIPYEQGEGGGTKRVLGCAIDITDRKEAELRETLLRRELQHRIKNLFTVVGSLIRLSGANAETPEEAIRQASDRVTALSWSAMLSLRDEGDDVPLRDLLEQALAAHRETGQVTLMTPDQGAENGLETGPELKLHYSDADAIGMILHELLTNAMKYGALSDPAGRLNVAVESAEGGQLRLIWDEDVSGITAASVETDGNDDAMRGAGGISPGFGQRLMAQCAGSVGGTIDYEWRDKGLRAVLIIAPSRHRTS